MASNKRQEMIDHLNDLAFKLKFEQITPLQKQKFSSELFSGVLKLDNNPEIYKARVNWKKADYSLTVSESIGLSIVTDTFTDAFAQYGTEEKMEDGKPIPFYKLFKSFLKVNLRFNYSKATKKFFEKNDEKTRLKKAALKNHLEIIASERGITDYNAPKNISNYDKLSHELQKLGYEEIEAIRQALYVIERINYLSMNYEDDQNNETSGSPVAAEADIVAEEKRSMQETAISDAIMTVVKTYETVTDDVTVSATDKAYVRYYLTKLIVENGLNDEGPLLELIDSGFAEYLETLRDSGIRPTYEEIAGYFGLQPDTVRKKMKCAQRILISKRAMI